MTIQEILAIITDPKSKAIFAERLKLTMQERGLHAVDVVTATEGEISYANLYRYRRAMGLPNAKKLSVLAGVLGVSIEYLFNVGE